MWYGAAYDGTKRVVSIKSTNRWIVQDTVYQAD